MEYQENYEVDSDGFAVPDVPHMEIMFDALEHTAEVEGTESLPRFNNLTQQQHYAIGALSAVGIRLPEQRHGMEEGFFGSIGNAFAAVWDYIKKTFKAIWDFFFSRDSKKEAEDAEESIDADKKKLKDAESGSMSDEDAAKAATKMAAVTEGKVSEDLKKAKTPAERKKAIKAALADLPKMNKTGKDKLLKTVQGCLAAKSALAEAAKQSSTAKETRAALVLTAGGHPALDMLMDMSNEMTKFTVKDATFVKTLTGFIATPTITVQQAIAFGDAAKKNVQDVQELSKGFDTRKGKIQDIINKTEAKMKKAKDENDKKALKGEIDALRTLMVSATKVSKLISANYTRVAAAEKHMAELFCL